MKKLLLVLTTFAVLFGLSYPATAALVNITDWDLYPAILSEQSFVGTDGYVNSGTLLGVFEGNESNQLAELESWLAGYYGGFELQQFAKYDVDENKYEGPQADQFEVIVAPGGISGTWATSGAELSLYVVKGTNNFALYEVNPAANSGQWSAYDLWVHGLGGEVLEISHVSGFNPTSTSVPEPASMLLLGVGLIGLAGLSTRKLRTK